MVSKLIMFFLLMSHPILGAKLYCRANSNNIYLESNKKELNIDDFSFLSDSSNPSWINCNLFINSLFQDGNISIKYKPLYNLSSARLLSDTIIDRCINFKYCKLNISSVLSRPNILYRFAMKKYERLKPSFADTVEYRFENELLDLSKENVSLLEGYNSPVDVAFKKSEGLEVIATMTFDTDALNQTIAWAKKFPSKTLDIYFSAQLQFLIDKVDLSLLDQFENVKLHPIFLSRHLPNSFHIKTIIKKNSLSFFTINLKKSNFLLNDAFIEVKSSSANAKVKEVLRSIDYVNCKSLDGSNFFISHYPRYKNLFLRYENLCQTVKITQLKSSRLTINKLHKKIKYKMFTHILHPYTVRQFITSKFYTSKLSVADSFDNVLFNQQNHYKFILGEKCVFYSSSNLTPTAFGNVNEIAFKSCNPNFYKAMNNLANKIKGDYKRQDVL